MVVQAFSKLIDLLIFYGFRLLGGGVDWGVTDSGLRPVSACLLAPLL